MIILYATDVEGQCGQHDNVLLIDLLRAATSLIIEHLWKYLRV